MGDFLSGLGIVASPFTAPIGLASGIANHSGGGDPSYVGEDTGTPALPSFLSDLDANGNLKSNYNLGFNSFMPDEEAKLASIPQLNRMPLDQIESYVNSGDNNPWVAAQKAALEQNAGQAMGNAKTNATAQNAAALDTMATRGGLNSGSLENLVRNGANNSTMAGQNVVGQKLGAQNQIESQNAQNQLGMLSNLPGQEVQALQPALQEQSLWQQAAAQNQGQEQQANEFNISNSLSGLNAQNNFNMSKYQNDIAAQAGKEQAQAQQKRGKK